MPIIVKSSSGSCSNRLKINDKKLLNFQRAIDKNSDYYKVLIESMLNHRIGCMIVSNANGQFSNDELKMPFVRAVGTTFDESGIIAFVKSLQYCI